MIIWFEERTTCLSRQRFISAPFKSCNIVQWRICILMCKIFPSVHRLPTNIIMQTVITCSSVVSAFMMQLISIVVDECVVIGNNAI